MQRKAFRLSETPLLLKEVKTTDIQECANLYQRLLNKNYIFTIEGDITFTIKFQKSGFHHLLGLHKLTDQQVLVIKKPGNEADVIYEKILNQEIPASVIEKSVHYYKIENRIKYFERIFDVLDKNKSKIIVDFDYTKLEHSELVNTKYILYSRIPEGYFLFTLGESRNTKIYPETIFFEPSSKYISNQYLLDIYDIKIISIKSKNKTI